MCVASARSLYTYLSKATSCGCVSHRGGRSRAALSWLNLLPGKLLVHWWDRHIFTHTHTHTQTHIELKYFSISLRSFARDSKLTGMRLLWLFLFQCNYVSCIVIFGWFPAEQVYENMYIHTVWTFDSFVKDRQSWNLTVFELLLWLNKGAFEARERVLLVTFHNSIQFFLDTS